MRDVTLSVVHNLSWTELKPYAVSLFRSSCASDMKVIIVTPATSAKVRENFTRLGFMLVESPMPTENPIQWDEWGWLRFHEAAKFLRSSSESFRYVMWTDARDVVFQSNPFAWLEKNLSPFKMAIAGLGHAVKDCPQYNDPWVKAVAGSSYDRIREFEALACGTFGGEALLMREMFEDIYDGCISRPTTVRLPHPQGVTDQGVFNVLAHEMYAASTKIPRPKEGFAAQWWPGKSSWPEVFKHEGLPLFDRVQGLVITPETFVPYSIVHLYDRDPLWVEIMRNKYQ